MQESAISLLKKAIAKGLISGRGPTGVAAAAVYISCNVRRKANTEGSCRRRGVTEVTIRNRYRELKKELGLKVNL